MKKVKLICIFLLFTLFIATQAYATVMYSDLAAWKTAAGASAAVIDQSGMTDGQVLNALPLVGGGSIGLSSAVTVYTANGTWDTWPNAYDGKVLFTGFDNQSITLTFASAVAAFGLWMEPNPFAVFDMTMALSDGSSLTQSVDGDFGAKFFGWADWTVGTDQAVTLSMLNGVSGFAFTASPSDQSSVPIPAAVWLFGSGLLGLFGVRRKITK